MMKWQREKTCVDVELVQEMNLEDVNLENAEAGEGDSESVEQSIEERIAVLEVQLANCRRK